MATLMSSINPSNNNKHHHHQLDNYSTNRDNSNESSPHSMSNYNSPIINSTASSLLIPSLPSLAPLPQPPAVSQQPPPLPQQQQQQPQPQLQQQQTYYYYDTQSIARSNSYPVGENNPQKYYYYQSQQQQGQQIPQQQQFQQSQSQHNQQQQQHMYYTGNNPQQPYMMSTYSSTYPSQSYYPSQYLYQQQIIQAPTRRKSKQSTTWSSTEDKLLRNLKEVQKLGWREISTFFEDRTPNACQFRWRRIISGITSNNVQKEEEVLQEEQVESLNEGYVASTSASVSGESLLSSEIAQLPAQQQQSAQEVGNDLRKTSSSNHHSIDFLLN